MTPPRLAPRAVTTSAGSSHDVMRVLLVVVARRRLLRLGDALLEVLLAAGLRQTESLGLRAELVAGRPVRGRGRARVERAGVAREPDEGPSVRRDPTLVLALDRSPVHGDPRREVGVIALG